MPSTGWRSAPVCLRPRGYDSHDFQVPTRVISNRSSVPRSSPPTSLQRTWGQATISSSTGSFAKTCSRATGSSGRCGFDDSRCLVHESGGGCDLRDERAPARRGILRARDIPICPQPPPAYSAYRRRQSLTVPFRGTGRVQRARGARAAESGPAHRVGELHAEPRDLRLPRNVGQLPRRPSRSDARTEARRHVPTSIAGRLSRYLDCFHRSAVHGPDGRVSVTRPGPVGKLHVPSGSSSAPRWGTAAAYSRSMSPPTTSWPLGDTGRTAMVGVSALETPTTVPRTSGIRNSRVSRVRSSRKQHRPHEAQPERLLVISSERSRIAV